MATIVNKKERSSGVRIKRFSNQCGTNKVANG